MKKQVKTKMIRKPKEKTLVVCNKLRYSNPQLFEEFRMDAINLWNDIAYDYLQICPHKKCSADEARSAVADRMTHNLWWRLSDENKEDILREAISGTQVI